MTGSIFWNGMKVSFLIIGTTIGAGYASGREIWEFFSSYGSNSSYYLLLSILLFSISCYVIMSISNQLQAPNYVQVLEELLGKPIAKIYDVLILFYLLSTSVVMFAGGGATVEYWSLPYWIGVGIMSISVFVLFLRDVEVMISLNSILIPLLIFTLIIVCLLFLWKEYGQTEAMLSEKKILPSAIAFTSLNIMPLIAVLSALGARMGKAEIKIASISSALSLAAISVLYNEALLKLGYEVLLYEVPLFAILRFFPAEFMIGVSLILWLAIYTTAISNIFGLVSRFRENIAIPPAMIAGIIILVIIPLTKFGFANLIKVLYPLYGILNLFILMTILLYPLTKKN